MSQYQQGQGAQRGYDPTPQNATSKLARFDRELENIQNELAGIQGKFYAQDDKFDAFRAEILAHLRGKDEKMAAMNLEMNAMSLELRRVKAKLREAYIELD